MRNYQSIILDLRDLTENEVNQILKTYREKYSSSLNDSGTLWIISNSAMRKDGLEMHSFLIAEILSEYWLKNIIIVPDFSAPKKGVFFDNCTYHILFFSKNEDYYFNKDSIRERHIWKDVEWGRRKENYHPLGKDPGNVWIKTEDDGKGKITKHVPLKFSEVLERVVKCSTSEGSRCLMLNMGHVKLNKIGVEVDHG